MAATVKASILYGPKDLRLEEKTLEAPAANEVQVAVKTTGLCGSDLHYYLHGRNGDITLREPLALGHESAGIVTAVGQEVKNLSVGDRVALEVGVPCDKCSLCTRGRYNLCREMRFRSSAKIFPHFQGTLQERINHPAKWCWKLPDKLSLELGALIEPMSVALHALDRASIPEDTPQNILVFGAGAVGILVAAALRLESPRSNVVIADVDGGRVSFATENSFAQTGFVVPLKRGLDTEENLAIAQETTSLAKDALAASNKQIEDFGKSEGFDVVFECTGQETCLQSAIFGTRPGGKVMMIGMGTPIQTLPISAAALREVDLLGVFRYRQTYSRCIRIIEMAMEELSAGSQVPDIRKLITHRVQGLEQVPQAFKIASRPVDADGQKVLKVLIET